MGQNQSKMFLPRSGPFFYLSKLESSNEAKLWADIFDWTEKELGLRHGTIKACVLIENILASFDMENILYQVPVTSSLLSQTVLPIFFHFPFLPAFPLSDLSCLHFRTNWLSRLGLGNQVGSTTDHLANCYLPSTPKDRSTMKEELTE